MEFQPRLIVANARPGLIRGGRANPQVATYGLGEIAPDHLAELLEEPAITVAIGFLALTPADIERLARRFSHSPDAPPERTSGTAPAAAEGKAAAGKRGTKAAP